MCSHLNRRSIHFFLLEFKLFLKSIHILVSLMGQTFADIKQVKTVMTMLSIFLVNLHLWILLEFEGFVSD